MEKMTEARTSCSRESGCAEGQAERELLSCISRLEEDVTVAYRLLCGYESGKKYGLPAGRCFTIEIREGARACRLFDLTRDRRRAERVFFDLVCGIVLPGGAEEVAEELFAAAVL